ncbi:MAG: HlyD family type I secretion periplasmic adaptor subunit [Burkholderiales bacterium]|nr:HlyD family type I secretion periplasmic adaptor subunit [Burkholderiales bacterium]
MNDHPGDLKPSIDTARAAALLQRLREATGRPGAAPSPETLAIQEALSRLAVIERSHLKGENADPAPAPVAPEPRPAMVASAAAAPAIVAPAAVPPAATPPGAHAADRRAAVRPPVPSPRPAAPQPRAPQAADPRAAPPVGARPARPSPLPSSLPQVPAAGRPIPLSTRLRETVDKAWTSFVADPDRTERKSDDPSTAGKPSAPVDHRARLLRLIKPAATAGLVIIGLVFGVAGTWAALAPLAGAAIATGVVSPDGSRKTIQHLEGGIIKEILVKEGDTVVAGQTLYKLEVTQAQANYSARREQWLRLVATRARLEAHAKDALRMTLPREVQNPDTEELIAFVENQQQLFELRKRGLEERESILRQQLKQIEEQSRGKKLENEGLDLQLKLLEEEAEDKATLVRQRLARKPEYLAIQRSIAEVKSRIGSNIATIGSLEERMGEISLQVNAARTQFRDQNAELLMKTNNDLAQLEESLTSSQDILRRTEIVAPGAGTVLNMRFRTVGGVVRPGEPVVDLVPREDNLVIDARLPATDIDVVRSGLPAMVHLIPYLTRDTPMLEGVVTHVSADSNVDQKTEQRFYELKVKVDRSKLDALGHTIELSPGMPVEVFVMTRNRTALGYMFEPLTRSFRRAFRED